MGATSSQEMAWTRLPGAAARLPIVDLSRAGVAGLLREVCGVDGPGFFYLAMRPDEAAAADEVLRLSRGFFDLAGGTKAQLRNGPEQYYRYRGWRVPASGPGYRALAEDANFAADGRESFNCSWDPRGRPDAPLGPTPWPDEAAAPGFRSACERYAGLLCERGHQLRGCLAEALGLPRDHFDAPGLFDCAPWLLGMVHYLPVTSEVSKGRYGIAPHQDDGIFTLLHTDGSSGLQVCPSWGGSGVHRDAAMQDPSLEWVDVVPLPGHWLVNLGTLLARWSNGFFKATLHRVVIGEPRHRYSVPFFYEANLDAPVECLPGCEAWRPGLAPPVPRTTPGEIMLDLARRDGLELLPDARL